MYIGKRCTAHYIKRMVKVVLCFFFLFVSFFSMTAMAVKPEQKTVRVGFYSCPFNIKDENGHMSGYAYDYQQDIAAYTGWKYEYVYASWPELLQMLKDGEIDLLSDVSITTERKQEMLFSTYSMGTESYYLYVSNSNKEIDQSDYSTLEGKRIGVNAGSLQADLFHYWTKKKGISTELIPCNGDEVMLKMLENGELDAVVAVDYFSFDNTVPMIQIGESDFYFAVSMERPDLKAELDDAMHRILNANRYYNEELYQKYLNANASKSLPMEDLRWIEEHGAIRVGYLDNFLAYCDKDDTSGELVGALQKFLNIAKDCLYNAPLEFEPIAFSSSVELRDALKTGEVDCIFPIYFDRYSAEQSQMYVTDSIIGTSMIALVDEGFDENGENVVAIYGNSIETHIFVGNNYPSWTVVNAASEEECINMVRKGEVDCAVFSANRVNHIIKTRNYEGLTCVTLSSNAFVSFAVQRNNVPLLHILNQVINAVPESAVNGAITFYATAPGNTTFSEFVKDNMSAVLAYLLVLAAIFAIIGFVYIKKMRKASKEVREALVLAERANQAKTKFLNNMSHDIRTPMNAIIGFTNIAMKHQPKPEVQSCLEKIGESSEHLLTLINDVLDISRIESGKIKYNPVSVDISSVTDVVLDITNGFLDNRDLEFTADRVKLENPFVLADAVRIREVLVNILSNAVKFTNEGGSIHFKTEYYPGKDDKHIIVHYCITDTGVGMSKEFIEKIFDEFAQEENGARTQYKGTGLGMAITKRYVEMMGGTISVKSEKGKGTTVSVELPLELVLPDNIEKEDSSDNKTDYKANLTGIKVLLAEDNDLNAEIAQVQLEEYGMCITRVVDGKEAVDAFSNSQAGTYDLILMDVMMPNMDGYEATKQIRSMKDREDAGIIPIIAMTANAFAEDIQTSLDAGMNAHIAKPLVMEEVIRVISQNIK